MDEKILTQIDIVFNEIVSAYEKMAELYDKKKEALIKSNTETLMLVDEKIIENYNTMVDLNNERVRIVQQTGAEEMNISEIIEKAEAVNSPLVSKFNDYKVKISEVSKRIALLEQTNVELIKHGLEMSGKTLNIIITACAPQDGGYDKHGKNVHSKSLGISSVCEDA